jgi:hypothetical protein
MAIQIFSVFDEIATNLRKSLLLSPYFFLTARN